MKTSSDEELMMLYQKDGPGAFDVLYQRYAGKILSYLRKKVRSDKVAQDLVQEVFLKLHRSRSQYNPKLPFSPWIFSISRSVFLDFAKKKSIEDVTGPEEFDKFQTAEVVSKDKDLELLAVLPDSQKKAVSLRVYDDATFEEIAERLSTTPENARQLFSRGLKKLKLTFKERSKDESE